MECVYLQGCAPETPEEFERYSEFGVAKHVREVQYFSEKGGLERAIQWSNLDDAGNLILAENDDDYDIMVQWKCGRLPLDHDTNYLSAQD